MIYQWVYTYSCWSRKKRETDPPARGFCTFSWTEGLDIAEIDELERRCSSYKLPLDCNFPARPTREEIDELFPVGFFSFTLASGKRALVRTCYVGECFYDKRWGAIMSHGLILEKGQEWPLYPMEYFDSPVFWRELPAAIREEALACKEQKDPPPPPYLPALELEDLCSQKTYTPEKVAARMAESPEFAAKLSIFFNEYMAGKGENGLLCISAPVAEVPWLFAGVTMMLPRKFSSNLSFSTFLSDKMPGPNESGRWYNIAATESRFSRLNLKYADNAEKGIWDVRALWQFKQPFEEFLENFSSLQISVLPDAVTLYKFLREQGPLSDAEWPGIMQLLSGCTDLAVCKEFITALLAGSTLPGQFTERRFEEIFSLVAADELGRPLCYELFLKFRRQYQGDLFAAFTEMAEKYPREITVLWLEEYALTELTTIGLQLTFRSLSLNGVAGELGTSAWDELFDAGKTAGVNWQTIVSAAPTYFSDCFTAILNKCPDSGVLENVLNSAASNMAQLQSFVEKIFAFGNHALAKDMLRKYLSRNCSSSLMSFRQIMVLAEKLDPSFAKSCFSDFFFDIEGRIAVISSDDLSWLYAHLEDVPEKTAGIYLRTVDAKIPFPEYRDPAYLALLERILADDAAAELRFWHTGFAVWFLKTIDRPLRGVKVQELMRELSAFKEVYRELTPQTQMSVCEFLLSEIIENSCAGDEMSAVNLHREILLFFGAASEPVREWLVSEYVDLISVNVKNQTILYSDFRFIAGVKCALGELGDEELSQMMREELAHRVFKKFSKKGLKKAAQTLGIFSMRETRYWDEVCREVARSNSFIVKCANVVNFIFNTIKKVKIYV
ncbi:MAG: hypothetical protein E7048_07500 [Lentisphaerae bacterium]|nr:hypothetical protein [Lentisphaerota bacterium]